MVVGHMLKYRNGTGSQLTTVNNTVCIGVNTELKRRSHVNFAQSHQQLSSSLFIWIVSICAVSSPCGDLSLQFLQKRVLSHYVNVSGLIKFSQKTSIFTIIIISSP